MAHWWPKCDLWDMSETCIEAYDYLSEFGIWSVLTITDSTANYQIQLSNDTFISVSYGLCILIENCHIENR